MGKKKKRHKGRPAHNPVPPPRVSPIPSVNAGTVTTPKEPEDPGVTIDGSFWRPLLSALETRPMGQQKIRGASGIDHQVVDVGVDEIRNRVILITDTPEPKASAFIQSDVQQLYPQKKVIVARTLLLPNVARHLKTTIESTGLKFLDLRAIKAAGERKTDDLSEALKAKFAPLLEAVFGDKRLHNHSAGAYLMQLISQLGALNWSGILSEDVKDRLLLEPLVKALDEVTDIDAQLGLCPLPIHALGADEVENVKTAAGLLQARELLERHGIWEYFFPKSDELVLGLVDRGFVDGAQLKTALTVASERGHLIDEKETIPDLPATLAKLKEQGLTVEGEHSVTTTVAGRETRTLVKFKPKESLLTKIQNLVPWAGSAIKYLLEHWPKH